MREIRKHLRYEHPKCQDLFINRHMKKRPVADRTEGSNGAKVYPLLTQSKGTAGRMDHSLLEHFRYKEMWEILIFIKQT